MEESIEDCATRCPVAVSETVRDLSHLFLLEVTAEVARNGGDIEASGHSMSKAAQGCCTAFAAQALACLAASATAISTGANATIGGISQDVWGLATSDTVSASTAKVLRRLSALFSLHALEDLLAHSAGVASRTESANLRKALQCLCYSLRPDALAIAEAWDFSDSVLHTEIGRRDGDVYGHYLRRVAAQTGETASTPSYWSSTIGAALRASPNLSQ